MKCLVSALLPNGDTQLWALNDPLDEYGQPTAPPWAVYTTIRPTTTPGTDPVAGWTPWKLFAPAGYEHGLKAQSLQTALDDAGRAYLWIDLSLKDVCEWNYMYTNERVGIRPAPSVTWSGMTRFPTPSAASADAGPNVLSAAPLLGTGLQLAYRPEPQGGSPAVVSAISQRPGQPPTSWSSWQTPLP
jgi:hypothetical protein